MPSELVKKYRLTYNDTFHKGGITVYTEIEGSTAIRSASLDVPESLLAYVADLLRNEKPVYYNRDTKHLHTGLEETGEEEG